MEEKKKFEELKAILENIQKVLELYNSLNPEEKITITPQDKKKDVSDTFVCVYNDKHVGLFKRINWQSNERNTNRDGSIYEGIDSDYIGMKKMYPNIGKIGWEAIGTKIDLEERSYIANCKIQNEMSFDDMRLIMYKEGQLKPYVIGQASEEELINVLSFAHSYYQLDQNIPRQKAK